MTVATVSIESEILAALDTVTDPELDQPITDLGFVRSVALDDEGVTVHLRTVDGIGEVRVLLDDHHDSDKINAGLAADAGYLGTFGSEAEQSLDELRRTFLRKAHTAAMERCVSSLMRQQNGLASNGIHRLTLRDLPEGREKSALLRRRFAVGLTRCPNGRVVVDDEGQPLPPDAVPMRLRFARSVRISIEGNAHFCRGMLATRYRDDGQGVAATQFTNTRTRSPQ
jgi:hypothetical protein